MDDGMPREDSARRSASLGPRSPAATLRLYSPPPRSARPARSSTLLGRRPSGDHASPARVQGNGLDSRPQLPKARDPAVEDVRRARPQPICDSAQLSLDMHHVCHPLLDRRHIPHAHLPNLAGQPPVAHAGVAATISYPERLMPPGTPGFQLRLGGGDGREPELPYPLASSSASFLLNKHELDDALLPVSSFHYNCPERNSVCVSLTSPAAVRLRGPIGRPRLLSPGPLFVVQVPGARPGPRAAGRYRSRAGCSLACAPFPRWACCTARVHRSRCAGS